MDFGQSGSKALPLKWWPASKAVHFFSVDSHKGFVVCLRYDIDEANTNTNSNLSGVIGTWLWICEPVAARWLCQAAHHVTTGQKPIIPTSVCKPPPLVLTCLDLIVDFCVVC
jgi:hypothetical protein